MQAKELIEILVNSLDFKKTEIARAIGVCKHTILKWAKGDKPRDSSKIDKLIELIKENGVNIENESNRITSIKKGIKKLKHEDWSNLIQGILFSFKMTEKELASILGTGASNISLWLNLRTGIRMKSKFRIFSFIKKNNESETHLIKLGKKVKSSIILDGQLIDKTKSKKRSELTENLLISKNNKICLNTPLLSPSTIHGNDIKFIFWKKDLIVFFENKNKENPFPLKLPRFIDINGTLLIGLGIWIGEGTKTRRRPKITNSEPVIIKQAIKFFNTIGIDKEKLNAWIQVHERSPSKNDKEKLKRFWSEVSRLSMDQIKDVRIKKDSSKDKNTTVKEMGTLHLECNLILSRLLIHGLLLNVETIAENIPNSGLFLLKGIAAGEGWCGQTKQGVVNQITITFKEKRWRRLTLDLLSKIGIIGKENERESEISICSFRNLQMSHEIDMFQFHPVMKRRLANGLALLLQHNIPFRNKERIIELLNRSEFPLTVKEISRLLSLKRRNVNKHLLGLFKANKISRKEGSGPIPHKWFIDESNYFTQRRNDLSSFFGLPSFMS